MTEVLEYIKKSESVDMKVVLELVVDNPEFENIYKRIKDTNE